MGTGQNSLSVEVEEQEQEQKDQPPSSLILITIIQLYQVFYSHFVSSTCHKYIFQQKIWCVTTERNAGPIMQHNLTESTVLIYPNRIILITTVESIYLIKQSKINI
jgi:hypothetical protein